MSEELLPGFEFEPPVWFLVVPSLLERRGWPVGACVQFAPNYGPYALMFTDEDLGTRYLKDEGIEDRGILALRDPESFRDAVGELQHVGVSYVGIDCPTVANPRKEAWTFTPLNHLVNAARGM